MPSEAQARIAINKLLEEAGWRFLPDRHGRRENIVCEHRVAKKTFAPNIDLGADFQHASGGFVDYVLLNIDGRPVAVVEANEDGQETELVFASRDFERKFFSTETNQSFVQCFFEHAKRDPITSEIGKTICFAVSRRHATKLVTLLNEEATRRWPADYGAGSIFAVQVTSDQPGAQQMTLDFANNNLNGKSRWCAREFRDYDTSRTRVCVTVGMMTTGYDCEDVLNVVLARPIFSPTDFIQIKGRGTRLFTFKHGEGSARREVAKVA